MKITIGYLFQFASHVDNRKVVTLFKDFHTLYYVFMFFVWPPIMEFRWDLL